MARSFKVSVEPLATARIKQINYEGEEVYQEKPSSSQLLTELAQRVDFSAVENKDDSETGPPVKKSVERWPWEETHSKLKQALMEVNVLADLLRMTQDHKHHVMLDPVLQEPNTVKLSYQLYNKRKAIAAAADILQVGAKNLNTFLGVSNSDHFHKALLEMRKRWKLRRTNTGIVGDLNYCSGRASYLPSTFGVHKGDSDQGTIVVTVPRELQGSSGLVVFLAPRPVKKVSQAQRLKLIGYLDGLHGKHKSLPPWEQQLKIAQKVLFNHELFMQLSRDAYHQKTSFPYEILTDQIHIPLRKDCWISVHHLREYKTENVSTETSHGDDVEPDWELTVSLLQSLRKLRSQWSPPRPAIAPVDNPIATFAGPRAMSTSQMQETEQKSTLFDTLLVTAQHLDTVNCVKQWLELIVCESQDPVLTLSWLPDLSSMKVTVYLHVKLYPNGTDSHCIEVEILADNKLNVKNGTTSIELTTDKERLCRTVRQQILIHQLSVARKEAEAFGWKTLQYNPYCLAVAPGNEQVYGRYNTEASTIVIETSDAFVKVSLSLEWGSCKVKVTKYSQHDTSSSSHRKPTVTQFELDHTYGSCFKDRLIQLLNKYNNTGIQKYNF